MLLAIEVVQEHDYFDKSTGSAPSCFSNLAEKSNLHFLQCKFRTLNHSYMDTPGLLQNVYSMISVKVRISLILQLRVG